MDKCFYLICPTDCLEHTINNKFKYDNYFYTSLGNSFVYDTNTISYITEVIRKHKIRDICFVLSLENKIVTNVLKDNDFLNFGTLSNFSKEIRKQKKHSDILFKKYDTQFTILSYYLNKKINDLELQLNYLSNLNVIIRGKIYDRSQDSFTIIYPDIVCLEKFHLN